MRLDQLPLNHPARIGGIDGDALAPQEAKRLQEMGFDEGVAVEALHHGVLRGPISCRVGRMTVALRRALASAVIVEPA